MEFIFLFRKHTYVLPNRDRWVMRKISRIVREKARGANEKRGGNIGILLKNNGFYGKKWIYHRAGIYITHVI